MTAIEDSAFTPTMPSELEDDAFQTLRTSLREPLREPLRHRVARRKSPARRDMIWNVLTVLVWLMMACTVMAFASIYANPRSLLNPFRPMQPANVVAAVSITTRTPAPQATETPMAVAALAQGDPAALAATELPPTEEPTATMTPEPTATETPTPGPSATATVHSLYPFIQRGEIKTIDASTFPDHDTCKLWVAGQAYDLQGAPMVGITVMLGGYLDYKNLYQLSLTGTALQYGQAGYEFTVVDVPVKSKQAVWVELFDQAMIPLSGKVYFDTSEDCTQNLVLINFRQVR